MPHDVFISHSSLDKTVADAVCATLEAKKVRCWITPRDVLPGMSWGGAIVNAINASRVMIVIFSTHSNSSRQVLREIEQAVKRGVTVVPLRIEDVPLSEDMDYFMSSVHWLDALTPPIEQHLHSLADTVSLLLARIPHRQAAPPAAPQNPRQSQLIPSDAGKSLAQPAQPQPLAQPDKVKPVAVVQLGKELVVDLGGGVKMEFVLIRTGSFMMGSEKGEEKPVHKVTITQPFYLGKYEVTQEQWQAVMGSNPSKFKDPKKPVEKVIWNDCQDFLRKLKEKAPGSEFCLPTEAQWEYACRAGTATEYSFGDSDHSLGEYAWYDENSGSTTHPVGEKKPNPWGLYDMHGNVYEWCTDWHDANYQGSAETDPTGAASGSSRVLRGGSWYGAPTYCRCACRRDLSPSYRNRYFGLRVVVVVR